MSLISTSARVLANHNAFLAAGIVLDSHETVCNTLLITYVIGFSNDYGTSLALGVDDVRPINVRKNESN